MGRRILAVLRPSADERIYANFQTYEAGRGAAAVYGVNVSRLAGIKHKYDRENFFSTELECSANGGDTRRSQRVTFVLSEAGCASAYLSPEQLLYL
jgi:hypothetical protein